MCSKQNRRFKYEFFHITTGINESKNIKKNIYHLNVNKHFTVKNVP